jgi:aminoglycoside phosphotransferase (APT) family kinase protein
VTAAELQERLALFIAEQVGASAVVVEGLRRMAGGASRETWSFDASYQSGGRTIHRPLILRRDPSAASGVQTSRREEFLLLRAARASGVAVPEVLWLGDDTETLGARFFIMQRIEGETIGRRLLRDQEYMNTRRVLTGQLGAALARIHGIDVAAYGLGYLPRPGAGESPARAEMERYEQLFRALAPDPHPAFELAFRWLWQRVPGDVEPRLVHGDYRIGNVIFGPEGMRAILDWELAHLGDPMEDLGWMCVRSWRFGNDHKPVGGIGERDELFAAYEAAGGSVDPRRVRFWEVFGNLRWATITISQARTYLDGGLRSVELASLGRRSAEMELELLNLMEEM